VNKRLAATVLVGLTSAAAAAQTPNGPEFLVNTYTTGSQFFPQVASDRNGHFVVVWISGGEDGSGYGVFAQRFDASGKRQGLPIPVNTYTTGSQRNPAVAWRADGSSFIVVWDSPDEDITGVYQRTFTA